jgi:hypothetical protein
MVNPQIGAQIGGVAGNALITSLPIETSTIG